jgi:hypothetical protein
VEEINAYKILVEEPHGKRSLGGLKRRWGDNIKIDLKKLGCELALWIQLTHDRIQWRATVKTVMNTRPPLKLRIFGQAEQLSAC